MRIVLNPNQAFLRAPVGGLTALARLERLARQLGVEITLADEWRPAEATGEILWLEGLFPLMERGFVESLAALGRERGAAVWRSADRPELGALFLSEPPADPANLNFADLEAQLGRAPVEFTFHAPALEPLDNARALSRLNRIVFRRKAEQSLDAGVWLVDPERVWIEETVSLEAGARVAPNVYLGGATRIAAGAEIGMGAWLCDVEVAAGAIIRPYSALAGATVGAGAAVGPFAHVRPGSKLGPDTRVGNFVETKQAVLAKGAKASHLAYLGDADIGEDCNIGAGTITCNYDGFGKNRTVLGDRVFVGSDSQLVAPIVIGDDALIGAGSTVVQDVPAGALAVSRARQATKEGVAARVRARAEQRKKKAEGRD